MIQTLGNDIVLPKGNVSKRHSQVFCREGRFFVHDLKSINGTYLNGRRITTPSVIRPGDKIYIGDFVVTVDMGDMAGAVDYVSDDGVDADVGAPPGVDDGGYEDSPVTPAPSRSAVAPPITAAPSTAAPIAAAVAPEMRCAYCNTRLTGQAMSRCSECGARL